MNGKLPANTPFQRGDTPIICHRPFRNGIKMPKRTRQFQSGSRKRPIKRTWAAQRLWPLDCMVSVVDPLLTAAAAGLRSKAESLDILANNLANANTTGFKADLERFTRFAGEGAESDPVFGLNSPNWVPDMERHWIDFTVGVAERTGRGLDLAIEGKGFFGVSGPLGKLYTRNGNFETKPDGTLVTGQGYPVLDATGGVIKVDPSRDLQITSTGAIFQQGEQVATIPLYETDGQEGVSKFGLNYFTWTKPARLVGDATIRQGSLEGANVSPAQSAVRLVNIMRQFESLQRAVSMSADMNRRSVEEVARVTG